MAIDPTRVVCSICGQEKPLSESWPAELVRESIASIIREERPEWKPAGYICNTDHNHFRKLRVERILEDQKGSLTTLDREVVDALHARETLSADPDREFERNLTLGERMSDRLANIGGSWSFLAFFALVLAAWLVVNSHLLVSRPFDPYPFIFLNLLLSCLAAIQAPVIMMSQNRQEAKDRLRSINDYRVNLKAELEIQTLNDKLDFLLRHQWQHLMEIQQIQTELIEEVIEQNHGK